MTEHVVSIITPVHPKGTAHLDAAYRSLLDQELPDNWSWEWIVQEDGQDGVVAGYLPSDPRISYSSSRRGGAGVARTMALSRARGELVKVLDADDELPPGALWRDIDVLRNNGAVDWTTSRVLDLLPDGSTAGFDFDPPEGTIRVGDVVNHWLTHDYRAQVHPATLCIRRSVLLMLGGWMALPASEDTGLLLSLNAVSTGYFIAEAGLRYRKWDGQATARAAHTDPTERDARMAVIAARARVLLDSTSVIRRAIIDASDPC